jgi:hypothetical protein
MTESITGRKRCGCGQYKTPLANGTMPRHTRLMDPPRLQKPHSELRVRCHGSGKFPPVTVAWRQARADRYSAKGEAAEASVTLPAQVPAVAPKSRGGHRAAKRNAALKARYRRNAAGGYGAV